MSIITTSLPTELFPAIYTVEGLQSLNAKYRLERTDVILSFSTLVLIEFDKRFNEKRSKESRARTTPALNLMYNNAEIIKKIRTVEGMYFKFYHSRDTRTVIDPLTGIVYAIARPHTGVAPVPAEIPAETSLERLLALMNRILDRAVAW